MLSMRNYFLKLIMIDVDYIYGNKNSISAIKVTGH